MNLWLILPVKPLHQSKSRLAPLLSAEERAQFSRRFLTQTLTAVFAVDILAGVLVVSRDPVVRAIAKATGAHVLTEPKAGDGADADALLNQALHQARSAAVAWGADAVLVVPTDLPLLTADELRSLCQLGSQLDSGVIIAPSQDDGTNALLLRPPHAIDFAYGPRSFHQHIARAQAVHLPVHVVRSPALALDLDTPQDIEQWQQLGRKERESVEGF